jgi:hypothetical protein
MIFTKESSISFIYLTRAVPSLALCALHSGYKIQKKQRERKINLEDDDNGAGVAQSV